MKKTTLTRKPSIVCVANSATQPSSIVWPGGGGTPIHYLYGYVPPDGGHDFEAPDLERGIHFRGVL